MRILIAYDGSECAEAAMAGLARAGLPAVCDATVLSVADVWLPTEPEIAGTARVAVLPGLKVLRTQSESAVQEAKQLAERGRAKLQIQFPQWQVAAEACADSPAWSIIKHAEALPTDLVVVGSHGRSGLGRMFLGSVSMRVLTELKCPVRIGRTVRTDGAMRIIVGADGSDDADAAIRVVRERRWPAGTQVRIVTAANWRLQTEPVAPLLIVGVPVELRAEQIARRASDVLDGCGLLVTTVVEAGDAKGVLVEQARSWNADCIFVGARGLTRVERILLGSVSSAVAMRAPCSVEIVNLRQAE